MGREVPDRDDDRDGERSAERPAGENVREPMHAEYQAAETDDRGKDQSGRHQQELRRWTAGDRECEGERRGEEEGSCVGRVAGGERGERDSRGVPPPSKRSSAIRMNSNRLAEINVAATVSVPGEGRMSARSGIGGGVAAVT